MWPGVRPYYRTPEGGQGQSRGRGSFLGRGNAPPEAAPRADPPKTQRLSRVAPPRFRLYDPAFDEATMDRHSLLLAAMSPAGTGEFSPVQVQKLLFLIERRLSTLKIEPSFGFKPYDYGPFAPAVYEELERLAEEGLVEIRNRDGRASRRYMLTDAGAARGATLLEALAPEQAGFIKKLVQYVRTVSFTALVSAIYREYPDMKVNSVFSA